MELAPRPIDLAPITGLCQALQLLGSEGRNEERSEVEDGDTSCVREPSATNDDHAVGQMASAGTAPELRASRRPVHADESRDLQEGEGTDPVPQETSENTEYVINKVIDHDCQDEKLFLKVDRYSYLIEDATWEPIEQLPHSAAVAYFRRKRLSLPAQVAQAQ